MSEEHVLDEENWKLEAEALIYDVKKHVDYISLSTILTSTNKCIYLNLKTKESNEFCVELSGLGLRIVGNQYDTCNLDNDEWFETPYSLLNTISPLFNTSFGNALLEKLNNLNDIAQ